MASCSFSDQKPDSLCTSCVQGRSGRPEKLSDLRRHTFAPPDMLYTLLLLLCALWDSVRLFLSGSAMGTNGGWSQGKKADISVCFFLASSRHCGIFIGCPIPAIMSLASTRCPSPDNLLCPLVPTVLSSWPFKTEAVRPHHYWPTSTALPIVVSLSCPPL